VIYAAIQDIHNRLIANVEIRREPLLQEFDLGLVNMVKDFSSTLPMTN